MPDPAWLAEIAALEQAATEGPWDYDPEQNYLSSAEPNHTAPSHVGLYPTDHLLDGKGWHGASTGFAHADDGAFIAAARTAVPKLVQTCRALAAELEASDDELMRLYGLAGDADAPLIIERSNANRAVLDAYRNGKFGGDETKGE